VKALLLCSALFLGQINTLLDKPVAHLPPNRNTIGPEYGGDLLELNSSPAVMFLPAVPPKIDSKGRPWSIDVKNLGPHAVTVAGSNQFSALVNVGRTIHIVSNATEYSVK
jgi:hypothetical protein